MAVIKADGEFSVKGEDEIVLRGFDFVALLSAGESISSAEFEMTVVDGVDPDVEDMLEGDAQIYGSRVAILIKDGVVGVIYKLKCTIETSIGQTLILNGRQTVDPD